jgi:hypothetical protein
VTTTADDGRSRGKSEQRPPKADPARIGRRVFQLAYWVLVVWVVVAAFVSVVRQVFWPADAAAITSSP